MKKILKEKFGFTDFRLGQEEAVSAALSGKNSLVMLPTGTGKSLCYQLPSYFLEGITIIISPLLSLMHDQVETIKLRGEHRVAAINSLISKEERAYILNHLGNYRYLFLSPEMISNSRVIKVLKKQEIALFVVDEAHCISAWGMDFRPEYLQLGEIINELYNPPVMALTATATEKVRKEIINYLFLKNKPLVEVVYPVDRPEIYFHVEICNQDKDERLFYFLRRLNGDGIIYFRNKEECEQITKRINDEIGIKALFYHGDLDAIDREKIQQQFLNGEVQVICATSAFGMGVDKENIRFVIHYQLPESPEMYLQEVGRASRDQQQGVAILLYEQGDEKVHYFFQEQSKISRDTIQYIYNHFNEFDEFQLEQPLEKSVYYFARKKMPMNQVIKLLENHLLEQSRQLKYIRDYIYFNGCKREFILNYFDEVKRSNRPCCSYCNPEFLEKIKERPAKTHKKVETETLPWKQVITKLFKNVSDL